MFYRWLRRWGGLILLAGAAVAVAWILLLPKLPEPPPISPQPPETAPAVSATPVEPPDSPTTDQKPEPTPAPRNVTAPPPADDSGPIVDLRRTQERPTAPAGTEPTDPRKREPPQEFDRSPKSRQRGIERFGGTPQTETAVEAGLAWLAAHQSPSGIWDRFNFADQDPRGDRCTGEAIDRTTTSLDAGLTGLCVLAFLGAGYTDQDGPYREVVHNGVGALLEMQKEHGGFGPDPEDGMAGYNDSLATFALAEYYAMTRRPDVVEPLKRAVGRIVRNQQALGGWDYQPWPTIGRNDTSISAWMVQALHACAAAGIEVPRETLVKAALHFSRAAQPDGRVWYSDQGTGFELDGARQPRYRYGPAMTAAGLTCEQLLGWRLDDVIPRKQAALVLARPPSPEKFHGRDTSQLHSEYYWYYATVAMFQRGGGEWERWNAKLRDAVLPLQNREKTAAGRKRSAHGSWDPYAKHWGKWGKMGSRVYTTAICVLTLEIYYRHTPAYLTEDVLLTVDAWREYLACGRLGESGRGYRLTLARSRRRQCLVRATATRSRVMSGGAAL